MLVAVASAKGSPGATALAVLLASLWPREVALADVDPAGGDVALRYRSPEGTPLLEDRGLLSLGAAVRRGADVALAPHLQPVAGGLDVLVGVSAPEQVAGLGPVWGSVAAALHPADRDVVADCGRVLPGAALMPVLAGADAVVLVVQADVTALAHLRERLATLAEPLRLGEPGGVPLGVVVRAGERDPRAAADVEALLASGGAGVPVLGVIAEDARGVRALETARPGAGRTSFVRSGRSLLPGVLALAERRTTPAPVLARR
ncbi:hypothetical protein [Pseudokineococcus sp. 1T1Z-3]|uniref:hypothetical protein n=1 Tax=Pseudokineococcus sp. 1T1Z-3 TaxID=3132745 RepID=UPI0030A00D4E